jgi:ankyrin repeat protein
LEGKTPLHAAAQLGALGFVQVLLERGASVGEECIEPDCSKRFQYSGKCADPQLFAGYSLNENIQLWNALNFASCNSETTRLSKEREHLVKYLLEIPDAIPRHPRPLEDCRKAIHKNFPTLLPFYLRVADESINRDVYEEAEVLSRQFMRMCYDIADNQPRDISSVKVHKVLIDIEQRGLDVLTRHEILHCVIESTGDTLLHVIAAHAFPRDYANVIRYLVGVGGLNVNIQNKQMKTPLHIACEHNQSEICRILLNFGANIGVSCFSPCIEFPWKTPLYLILGCACKHLKHNNSPTSSLQFSIAEILLRSPGSIISPQHPKQLKHSNTSTSSVSSSYLDDSIWNQWVLERILDRFPSLLPVYLDHFYSEIRATNGETSFHFQEVKEVCKNLELMLGLEWEGKKPMDRRKIWNSSVVTHLVIRNAIDVKWKVRAVSLIIITCVAKFITNSCMDCDITGGSCLCTFAHWFSSSYPTCFYPINPITV